VVKWFIALALLFGGSVSAQEREGARNDWSFDTFYKNVREYERQRTMTQPDDAITRALIEMEQNEKESQKTD
jgi:hypothetical protein